MMKIALLLGITAAIYAPVAARSQSAPPAPSPEQKRLEFFVGKWRFEGTDKPSQYGPGGKTTGTSSCEWFEGHFQVVCRSDFSGPEGPIKQMEILSYSYSSADHAYHRYHIDSTGNASNASGTLAGKTWQWHGTSNADGKTMRVDFPWTETSFDSYTVKVSLTVSGGKPTTLTEGTATLIK